MGAEAPQWLVGAFVDALSEVGATSDRATREAEAHELLELWNAPGRSAHNFRHLIHVLTLIDELGGTAHDADILRIAAWYHGACRPQSLSATDTGVANTVDYCAQVTRDRLTSVGTPHEVIERIVELLDCLATYTAPDDDTDAQVLVDAALGRLALSPQEFVKYRKRLRDEFANLDDPTYYAQRRRAVVEFLARDTLFYTDLASTWEEVARSNLELELARIDEQLKKYCPHVAADEQLAPADQPESARSHTPEHDADLIRDDCVHATHAKVIKRRSVKTCPAEAQEELVTTGVLPAINALVEDSEGSESTKDAAPDSNLSSLESAIDTLGIV